VREGYRKINGKWTKRRSKRTKGTDPSPAYRNTPWVTVIIRAEHYVMLKELADFHSCTISAAAMSLIQEEFLKQLAVTDPEKARKLEEAYGAIYKNA